MSEWREGRCPNDHRLRTDTLGSVSDAPANEERRRVSALLSFWLDAAELQRDRIVENAGDGNRDRADAAFFAIAIRNVVRAADLARDYEPASVPQALGAFDSAVPGAVKVRDVLEHFDDYERGKGRLQESGDLGDYQPAYARHEDQFVVQVAQGSSLDVQSSCHAARRMVQAIQVALVGMSEDVITPPIPDRAG